jgi:hypothetical protein
MKKYFARNGAPFKKGVAQKYGERLEYLSSTNKGKITPDMVVKDAIQKKSVFHNYFEWDETEAAKNYRIQQARNLINHIVEVVVIEGKQSPQRSFFSVKNGNNDMVYVTVKKAISTPNYRVQLLNQLITTMENMTQLMKMFKSYEN